MTGRVYAAIDLKSFYASVECMERGLDPMTAHLVVADLSRTEKTICLAVTPALKAYGIPGRARLFEVIQRVKGVNAQRERKAPGRKLVGSSHDASELAADPSLALEYIVAPPQMALYIQYSAKIYETYLRHVAPDDIFSYSIDEVFVDLTPYLRTNGCSAREFVREMILDVQRTTGITAAAGIGTNLYLAKVAMDITAKHIKADEYGVRISELDEMSYRRQLWDHRPLTDFWRVGRGYAKKLEEQGLYTMGDIARCSLGGPRDYYREDLLYQMFGVNAELLIDHAWGWEPCRISDIKSYKPSANSICSGQVLRYPYEADRARLVVREMTDAMALELLDKGMVTDQLTLTIGYDIENLSDPQRRKAYQGAVTTDHYGRRIPKHAHGTANLDRQTSSTMLITEAVMELYGRIVNPDLLIRRLTLTANRVVEERAISKDTVPEQLDFFTDYSARQAEQEREVAALDRERKLQQTVLNLRKKLGKNAVLKGISLEDGATAKERNGLIGGHKA